MYQKVLIVLVLVIAVLNLVTGKPTPAEAPTPSAMCKLPEARGNCRALLPRWKYVPASGKCHEFKFGGCDGNGNNFMSQKACMNVCAGV